MWLYTDAKYSDLVLYGFTIKYFFGRPSQEMLDFEIVLVIAGVFLLDI